MLALALEATHTRDATSDEERTMSSVAEAPRLIVALDLRRPVAGGLRMALAGLDELAIGRGTHRVIERDGATGTLWLDDLEASRRHVAITRRPDGWQLVDVGSKNGTVVNGVRVATATLADGDLIELGTTFVVFREQGGDASLRADRAVVLDDGDAGFATLDGTLERGLADLARIARSDCAVLIRGETGSGKELIARGVHARSGRAGAFVPVRCSAMSDVREDHAGRILQARGGTVFLDDVDELTRSAQGALLRLLQEVEGDVRIVAATHRELDDPGEDGRLRPDLHARLTGYVAAIPPLRERRDDLGVLIASVLRRMVAAPDALSIHRAAARALLRYDYPHNVRELEQALRAALALVDGGEIGLAHLPETIRRFTPRGTPAQLSAEDRALRGLLIEALRRHEGNVAAVSRGMGKAPMQIRRWCSRLGIELDAFRLPRA